MLTPPLFTSLRLYIRNKSAVSFRSEVEVTPNLRLGRGVRISSFCMLKSKDGPLEIGDRTSISPFTCIASGALGLRIGEDCLIGPSVTIVASNHVYSNVHTPINTQGSSSKGISIGSNVWIGSGSTILDGAEIGDGSIVVSNAVVSGKVPPNTVVGGNPAETIFKRR